MSIELNFTASLATSHWDNVMQLQDCFGSVLTPSHTFFNSLSPAFPRPVIKPFLTFVLLLRASKGMAVDNGANTLP